MDVRNAGNCETETQAGYHAPIRITGNQDVRILYCENLPIIGLSLASRDESPATIIFDGRMNKGWHIILASRGIRDYSGKLHDCPCQGKLHLDTCFFIPSGETGELSFEKGSSFFMIGIRESYIRSVISTENDESDLPTIRGERLPSLNNVLTIIEKEMKKPGASMDILLEGLLRAAGSCLFQRDETTANKIYIPAAKLNKVLTYIEAHLEEPIGLEDMANAAGLSTNHFLRVFKQEIGDTPYHYLKRRRIEKALRLLNEQQMPLAELALECGFANQAHFTASFSREIGISPGRYRKEHAV